MTDRRREKRRNLILDTKTRPWTVWGPPRQGPGVKGVPVKPLSWVLRFEECGSTLGKEGRREEGDKWINCVPPLLAHRTPARSSFVHHLY